MENLAILIRLLSERAHEYIHLFKADVSCWSLCCMRVLVFFWNSHHHGKCTSSSYECNASHSPMHHRLVTPLTSHRTRRPWKSTTS